MAPWFRSLNWGGLQQHPISPAASSQLLEVLGAGSAAEVQDLISCLLLSEAIYKAAEGPPMAAVAALNELRQAFPPGLAPLQAVQFSRRSSGHRFLLARSCDTLYVAFLGTKHPADALADASFLTRLLWSHEDKGDSGSSGGGGSDTAAAAAATAEALPAVHRGFLGRAQAVPVEALYAHARRQGLRLVLCGHSLGGAVAQLCTLRLLHALRGAWPPPAALRCLAFGAPAVGNAALAEHVRRQAWGRYFTSVALPEDPVPRLLLLHVPATAAAPAEPAQAGIEAVVGQDSAAAAATVGEQAADAGSQADAAGAAPCRNGGSAAPRWPAALRAAGAARSAAVGLAQPLTAAAGVAASAARAGAGLLVLPPLLPSFAHLGGEHCLLLPHGIKAATDGASAGAAASTGGLPAVQQPRLSLLGLHSMSHYRARAASLCWRALEQPPLAAGAGPSSPVAAAGSSSDTDAPVELSHSLAPVVVVWQAVARLPVLLPPPSSSPQPGQQQPRQQQPVVVQMTVAVHGSGLECCTGAVLHLPGAAQGTALQAAALVNTARQRLLMDLPAAAAAASGGSAGSSGSPSSHHTGAASWLRAAAGAASAAVRRAGGRQPPAQQQQQPAARPGLVLQFAAPAAAIQQLAVLQQLQQQQQQQGQHLELPATRLVLLSDFGRHTVAAQLRPAAVWMVGLEPSLLAATFQQLQAAWAPAGPPAAEQQQWWRRRPGLPDRMAAPLRGLWAGTAPEAPAGSARPDQPAAFSEPPHPELQQSRVVAARRLAATRLASLRQQLSAWLPWQAARAAGDREAPPAVLLGGLLLLDATPALVGSPSRGSVARQLELAAEGLRWSASERQRQTGQAGEGAPTEAQQLQLEEGGEEEEEVEDEDLEELSRRGLAAQLRRQVARAGTAVHRRTALVHHLRRHAAQLRALPPPAAVLLVLHHRQLLASSYGEGLDGAVLAAVRQVASACRTCGSGVPLLLAVASSTPLSTPYRRQLGSACGLAATDGEGGGLPGISGGTSHRGSVVPLLLAGPTHTPEADISGGWEVAAAGRQAGGPPRVGPVLAALHTHAAAAVREWEQLQLAVRARL